MNPTAPPFRVYLAEVLGTFALVFAGTGAMIVDDLFGGVVTPVGIAVTFGLADGRGGRRRDGVLRGAPGRSRLRRFDEPGPLAGPGARHRSVRGAVDLRRRAVLAVLAYWGVYGYATRPPASVSEEPIP